MDGTRLSGSMRVRRDGDRGGAPGPQQREYREEGVEKTLPAWRGRSERSVAVATGSGRVQPFEMRNEATAFDREDKALGRSVVPGAETLRSLKRVERSVNLDGVDLP
jgi:hypothetical protein